MTEMVERVARALDERIVGGVTMTCGDLARVAIAAMREPTQAMVIAGGDLLLDGSLEVEDAEKNAAGVWRAMIAAALDEANKERARQAQRTTAP